jgi:CHAT domain-containing protein
MSNYKKFILKLLGLSSFLLLSNLASSTAATTGKLILDNHNPFLLSETAKQNSQSFINQGRVQFESGRFSEAANIWQQAANNFQKQGDKLNQIWSLSYASLAYQNLGEWQNAQATINKCLQLLQNDSSKTANPALLAVVLNTQGSLKIATGQTEAALKTWEDAERAYVEAGDITGKVGSQINQAQALQVLGLYSRAQKLLTSINQQVENQPDLLLKLKALRSLGVALQVVGSLERSQKVLEQSLTISRQIGSDADTSEILFSLGNTNRSLQKVDLALNYYKQAAATATTKQTRIQALLNQLSLSTELGMELPNTLIPEIKTQLENLPASRMSIYAGVNFAQSLYSLAKKQKNTPTVKYKDAAQILARGIAQAESINDLRGLAYSLNELSKLYETSQQLDQALSLSQKALNISQAIKANDISYQAAWQVGRIYKAKGDIKSARASYDSSVKTLKLLRSDLVAINRDVQFSFQESVEPVYREFVSLLLSESNPSQDNLIQAREVIEALQLAELDNFFREACTDSQPKKIDDIDKSAAIIYPIILGDRIEIILSLPGQPLSSYRTSQSQVETEQTIKLMRQSLNPAFSNQERLRVSQKLYDWLIRPAQSQLSQHNIKTLVFILDGSLRNLPMATLYDGKQYLMEKYNIALSPGLKLMRSRSVSERESPSIKSERLKAITAGLSEARQGFKALPGVQLEMTEISQKLSTKELLNDKFTDTNLKTTIKSTSFSILHFASHGQFSSKSDDTFILTWNGKINVKELNDLLQERQTESNPVELMVLSACQTAKGDNRAILGLAGVAVRSGARSTLGTLWAVQDESTAKFMVEFYKQLSKPGIFKAQALRNTQLEFLKNQDYSHPFYWASFVLIGNWL